MDNRGPSRGTILRSLGDPTKELNAHELDLIAQLEAHLRVVHHTMRKIGTTLRASYCVGPEPSNDGRREPLDDLGAQITEIDSQSKVPQEVCHSMDAFVVKMLSAAMALKIAAEHLNVGTDKSSDEPSAQA